jgi:Zn-dependent M28 family amino/carboxypeptidase
LGALNLEYCPIHPANLSAAPKNNQARRAATLLSMPLPQFWQKLSKNNRKRLILYPSLVLVPYVCLRIFTYMPGDKYTGPFAPLDKPEQAYESDLRRHIQMLAGTIGDRNISKPGTLEKTRDYLASELTALGYRVDKQVFQVGTVSCENLAVDVPGSGQELVLVGAHYDTAQGASGADDNGSGVAGVLALAKTYRSKPQAARGVRFVLFANEEPPYFWTNNMGSVQYAQAAKVRGDQITAMLSLETIGFYQDAEGTQKYPAPLNLFYGSKGDFIGFVGNTSSRSLVQKSILAFRESTKFPSEGAALPGIFAGVGWSDHWSFWQSGYPALMITDTAPFRNPHYHKHGDLPDTLNYEHFARVVQGIEHVIDALASGANK